jgi:hypothetical protein
MNFQRIVAWTDFTPVTPQLSLAQDGNIYSIDLQFQLLTSALFGGIVVPIEQMNAMVRVSSPR